ncbi:ATP-binding protein [Streptomyces sp. CA-132043]|uniref:ATP-binding protein n=1 Tax=Streptomyces sp. CA-132043 TaxID=3240048 RepID=UPI003D8E8AFA
MRAVIQHEWLRERCYTRARRSVPEARAFAARAFADWGLGPRTDGALLCVSELATNALRHGVPPGRAFRLRLYQYADDGGTVRIEVHDSGPGWPRTPSPPSDADAEHGRGLLLVGTLADKWGVGERNPGKVVWCEFAAGAA